MNVGNNYQICTYAENHFIKMLLITTSITSLHFGKAVIVFHRKLQPFHLPV